MASVLRVHSFHGGVLRDARLPSSTAAAAAERDLAPLQRQPRNDAAFLHGHLRRRDILLSSVLPLGLSVVALPSEARERRGRKAIPPEEYMTSPDGVKYYDLIEGNGPVAEKGATVQVHFDCIYRSITAVSSRESKLLAGNRIIAQPYEFTVGSPPGKERKREYVDNANGLFSAQAAPKPPVAMYKITEGMRVGGKRTVIVPSDLGYGQKGMNEIPVQNARPMVAGMATRIIPHYLLAEHEVGF
ncbi:hypothetical protein Taro_026609 [Colocasia esculenta]|uniref:peptidylprolyl isomerase n=1 Tax=Colocasia esculenta TaxID=4460 RepID=A0A843VFP1_COLES|nr:hypothetical protein [Colocasia esculenta]